MYYVFFQFLLLAFLAPKKTTATTTQGLSGMPLVDSCYIYHQHIHLVYTSYFASYHKVTDIRTEPDLVYIEGDLCCKVMPDQSDLHKDHEGLCDLSVDCTRKWWGRKMPYLELKTSLKTANPVHHTFYICPNMTLDRSPAYYIENGPGVKLTAHSLDHQGNNTDLLLDCERLIGDIRGVTLSIFICSVGILCSAGLSSTLFAIVLSFIQK